MYLCSMIIINHYYEDDILVLNCCYEINLYRKRQLKYFQYIYLDCINNFSTFHDLTQLSEDIYVVLYNIFSVGNTLKYWE